MVIRCATLELDCKAFVHCILGQRPKMEEDSEDSRHSAAGPVGEPLHEASWVAFDAVAATKARSGVPTGSRVGSDVSPYDISQSMFDAARGARGQKGGNRRASSLPQICPPSTGICSQFVSALQGSEGEAEPGEAEPGEAEKDADLPTTCGKPRRRDSINSVCSMASDSDADPQAQGSGSYPAAGRQSQNLRTVVPSSGKRSIFFATSGG